MQNITPYIFAVNAVAAFGAGAYVYFVDKKKAQNSIWLVYNILFCIWNFCIYKALESAGDILTIYWFRTSLAALIFLVPVFLHFLSVYSDRHVFRKQVLGKIYIIFFLFFAASFLMPKEFIKDLGSAAYFKHMPLPGPAFTIFIFVFIGFLFCGFYYLLYSDKLYLRLKRNQRKVLFFGMLFGILAPFNFFFAVYGISFFPFGLLCVIPYLMLVSYAILKYHVFEVDVIINKTVVLAYFTMFVLLIHMFIVHVLHRIVGMEYFVASVISGCVVFLNILFTAHYAGLLRLSKVTDRIVYEKKMAYYRFLENFNSISNKIKDLDDLCNLVLDSLTETIGISAATLYTYDENSKDFILIAHRGVERAKLHEVEKISSGNPFVDFLKEGNAYTSNESGDFVGDYNLTDIKSAFGKINLRLTIPLYYSMPLYYSRQVIGFLNLGKKTDNTPYDKEDIDILNAFARQLSVCIDNTRLYYKAIEDDLTGLYRVNYFNKRIQEEIDRFNRYERPFSLIFIDVDDFKKINDTYGHQKGDEVLQKIGHLIKACLRKADIPARYGGEEFSILMPETDQTSAAIGAERLRKSVEQEFLKGEKPLDVTISVGIADYKGGMKKYELIKKADEALYRAKADGKNRIAL